MLIAYEEFYFNLVRKVDVDLDHKAALWRPSVSEFSSNYLDMADLSIEKRQGCPSYHLLVLNIAKSDTMMFDRGMDGKKKSIRKVGGDRGGEKVKGDGMTTAAKVK